jgi:succinyl-diaminopimelate desuccinylase
MTPAKLSARFNFRYSTVWNHETLKSRVHEVFDSHEIEYQLDWHLSGEPFLTAPGQLSEAVCQAIKEETGLDTELSTGGGTSDGRFISPTGSDVIELGPVNASIHKVNEYIKLADLPRLTTMYQRIMELLLT